MEIVERWRVACRPFFKKRRGGKAVWFRDRGGHGADHPSFTAMATDRIIATTQHENPASIAVMLRLKTNIDVYGLPHLGLQIVGRSRASER
jgi:hypothetical protein